MAKQHITLIRPSTVISASAFVSRKGWPSPALAYLAAVAREAGHGVTVVDAQAEGLGQITQLDGESLYVHGLTLDETLARIPLDTGFIGITCMFSNEWILHKQVINAICDKFPEVPVVVGGEHATACGEYVLRSCPRVAACAMGEGEECLIDLLNAVAEGRPLSEVAGLLLRDGEGGAYRTEERKRIRHLDSIPWPAWDLLPMHRYLDEGVGHGVMCSRNMPLLASRGCPYRCTFCTNPRMWGKLWNVRSAADVVAEMKFYKEKYNATSFSFYDLTAIIRKDWILEFTSLLIKEELNVQWLLPTGTRAEALDREVLRNLKLSGCMLMVFAPESGSPRMLELMKKQVKLDKLLESMRAGVQEGIITNAHIIFGMPGEQWSDTFQSIRYMFRMALAGVNDVSCFQYTPYPGSVLFDQLRAEGKFPPEGEEADRLMAVSQFNALTGVRSWNDNFTNRQLTWVLFGAASVFYGTQYLVRPWRMVQSIVRMSTSKPVTLLERVVFNKIQETLQTFALKRRAIVPAPVSPAEN